MPLESDPEVKKYLNGYRIPEGIRGDLLYILDLLGIGYRTLFPDLEGLCLHLNWKHKLE